jgi:hypothetical protein
MTQTYQMIDNRRRKETYNERRKETKKKSLSLLEKFSASFYILHFF